MQGRDKKYYRNQFTRIKEIGAIFSEASDVQRDKPAIMHVETVLSKDRSA